MKKSAATIARSALHLLTQRGLSPTPENYAVVNYEVLGKPMPEASKPDRLASSATKLDNDRELVKLVRILVEAVSASAANLAEKLEQRNVDIKNTVDAIEHSEEKQEIFNLLSIVINTSNAIHHSVEETHTELVNTRQSLENMRTELEQAKQHLMLDPLTGARNRFGMEISIEHEIARARRANDKFILAMVDLDHFKQVNDTYGHDAGDALLLHFSQLSRSVLRESDQLFRYGGEEFLMVLPDTDINGATFMFDRLKQMLAKSPLNFQQHKLSVTFSAGVAELKETDDAKSLQQHADQALYQAKQQGRNQTIVAP